MTARTAFTAEQIEKDENEAGIHLDDIGLALMIWTAMNHGKNTSVAEAARAFNTTAQVVREAVSENAWAFLIGPSDDPEKQHIDVDGE